MKKIILGILIIAILAALGLYAYKSSGETRRTISEANTNSEVSTGIDRTVEVLGITITPIELVEDSRCPTDATCAWAGTVNVRALLKVPSGEASELFEFGKPRVVEGITITLVEVNPVPDSRKPIRSEDYAFSFQVTRP